MEQLCFNGGGIIVSMFIVKLGTESIAANAVSNSTLMVFYSRGLAVSNLSVTIIGQCIGAKDKKMARYYGKHIIFIDKDNEYLTAISQGLTRICYGMEGGEGLYISGRFRLNHRVRDVDGCFPKAHRHQKFEVI